MKYGLLLTNLGTPGSPDKPAVRRYLAEFLADKRVITLPAPLRYLLLYGFILPFRPKKTAEAYQAIWTDKGSPLRFHSEALRDALQHQLGERCKVALGMRYGRPGIEQALLELEACEHIIVLPLFPQYSSAATGSSLAYIMSLLEKKNIIPSLKVIRDFHQHPAFIQAQAELIKPFITNHEMILFSYHGVPENQILIGPCKTLCKKSCTNDSSNNHGCYRAQCLRTTSALATHLGLKDTQYRTSFQSRLGKTVWIKPYTDKILEDMAALGIKNLAIACPSFVADCLETLEEIGIQAKEQWQALGGERLTLIPCLNANKEWVKAVLSITNLNE